MTTINTMKTSSNGLSLITRWEGLKLKRYICPAGKPTIGVGHVILPSENIPDTITEEMAMDLLRKDVERFEKAVNTSITVELNQNQFDALVCFVFNVGEGGLRNTGVQRAVNEKRFSDVPERLKDWSKAKINGVSTVLQGLLNRRKSEAELFMRPIDQTNESVFFVTFTKDLLTQIQTKLSKIGFYTKKIDGLYGQGTKNAIEAFASNNSITYKVDYSVGIRKDILDLIIAL